MVVLRHSVKLLKKVRREFVNNCLWFQIDDRYREQKDFQEAI